jgi:peptide/nickel transport system substrate-binding protein
MEEDMPARGSFHRVASPRWTRRRFLGVGAAAGTLLVAACGGKKTASSSSSGAQPAAGVSGPLPSGGTPKPGGTLQASATAQNPATLDPQRSTVVDTMVPCSGALSRLLRFKTGLDPKLAENLESEPDLALSAESPDALTWTLKLRQDVKFHNVPPVSGRAFDANDVLMSFARELDTQSPGRGGLGMIDPNQIQAPDKYTVVFKLKYPFALFTNTLASPTYCWISPREAGSGVYDPAKQIIGTGPFIFQSYTPDVGFKFTRNPDYFVKGQPYIDAVNMPIIADASAQVAQFTSGHTDEFRAVRPNDLDSMRQSDAKATVIRSSPGGPSQVIYYQLGDPKSPWQDIRLRRALSMAIDRDSLAKAYFNSLTEPQFNVYLQLGKWALHQSDLPAEAAQYYRYDPAKAKQMLQASGFADMKFRLVYFKGFVAPPYEEESVTIANMLRNAGFNVTAVEQDYQSDYINSGKGSRYGFYPNDEIIFSGPGSIGDPDGYIFNFFDSRYPNTITRLKDAKLEGMIDTARGTLDENARVKAYIDTQVYLADQMYSVSGLGQQYIFSMINPRIQNYQRALSYGYFAETYAKLWLQS